MTKRLSRLRMSAPPPGLKGMQGKASPQAHTILNPAYLVKVFRLSHQEETQRGKKKDDQDG